VSVVLDLASASSEPIERIGGKASGLTKLAALGCPVPPGFVVTTRAYGEWIEGRGLEREIERLVAGASGPAGLQSASAAIAALFAGAVLESEDIDRAYDLLGDGADAHVAVRSSAIAEDLGDASFAGQQETYLPVTGGDAVRSSIVRCWASLYSPGAIGYRRRLGRESDGTAMAVVVQRLVAAEAAGVLFTVDPLTGDPSQVTIEGAFGLGLPVVGGELTPDRFDVDKVTFEIRSRAIAVKPFADRFEPATAVVERTALSPEEASAPCLTDAEVVELARLGRRVERELGHAVDIEWAIEPGPAGARRMHLLQARPETVASARRPDAEAPRGAMDRIVSSLLGTNE
jgi:phosphoenolpyruvate synthase/pyruvate phosphate dikinase